MILSIMLSLSTMLINVVAILTFLNLAFNHVCKKESAKVCKRMILLFLFLYANFLLMTISITEFGQIDYVTFK